MDDYILAIAGLGAALLGWLGLKQAQTLPASPITVGTASGSYTPAQIEAMAMERAQQILHLREGWRLDVYSDKLGVLTVGIGHKVLTSDGLKFGDTITAQRAWDFFYSDVAKAFNAAKTQAKQVGKYTPEFIAALTSVNFQLGTGWTKTFYETWPALLRGDWQTAERNLRASLWYRQTPVRVEDFIAEIRRAYS